MNRKRLQSTLLALVMVVSSIVYYPQHTEEIAQAATSGYGLASNIQDGVILHCFDWKYNDIKAELPNIAAAGFTSIQTSPAQRA